MATVIFKATEECNARCIYCDVVHKPAHGPTTMPQATLELFFSRVNEFLQQRPDERLEIIWHGGEPLLLGPAYFEQAWEFQQKHCSQTADRIKHELQSNLTLFRKEFSPIFRKLGIGAIGTSFESIDGLRGLGPERDSRGYNKKILEAIKQVEAEGFGWSLIYVVTKPALADPLGIFQFLVNLSPRGGFMFNPVLLYGNKLEHLRVTAEEYADFLGTILPVWWANREDLPDIRPFSYLARNVAGDVKGLMCGDSGQCAYSHINLLPDGTLSHCGRSGDWGLLNYGTIFDKTFVEAFADPQRAVLLSRNDVLPQTDCKGCPYWKICHGGCPLDAWSVAGSYLHKGEWCQSMKKFIGKYLAPLLREDDGGAEANRKETTERLHQTAVNGTISATEDTQRNPRQDEIWIDPIGGLGDTLMLSGVLKQVFEQHPERQFNLVARSKYIALLKGHPAIRHIGHPKPNARLMRTNYWDDPSYGVPGARAYQVLAAMFDLELPAKEILYLPVEQELDSVLLSRIPWQTCNVLICPGSESPRKQMPQEKWEALVSMLRERQINVVQAGRMFEQYIRGAYDLRGLTTPLQLVSLMKKISMVVTSDNFAMHAAHLANAAAVVVWGPTDPLVYGYTEQVHLQAARACEYVDGCIGPGRGEIYATECSHGKAQCLNNMDVQAIFDAVLQQVAQNKENK